jgi:hypothetical protein
MRPVFVALNCNGAVVIDIGVVGCSGVIRDNEGNFRVLNPACQRGHSLIRVESYSLLIIPKGQVKEESHQIAIRFGFEDKYPFVLFTHFRYGI